MFRPYPVLIFFFSALLAVLMEYLFPSLTLYHYPYNLLSIPFLIAAGVILFQTYILFKKNETTIHPFKKPTVLIQDGPFKYSRNPIYLSFLLLLLSLSLFLGNVLSLLGPVVFVLLMNVLIIIKEERTLETAFGDDYKQYKKVTNRWAWLPKSLVYLLIFILSVASLSVFAFYYFDYGLYFKNPSHTEFGNHRVTTKETTVDGLKIYYKVAGDPNSPPLVLIHGTGGSFELVDTSINQLVAEFSKNFYVIAAELPGQLRSEVPAHEVSPEYYVEFIHAFIEQQHLDKYVLIGQSYGGRLVTIYATKYNNELTLLVIADSASVIKDRPRKYMFSGFFGNVIEYVYQSQFIPGSVKSFVTKHLLSKPEQYIGSDYTKYSVMGGLFKNIYTDYTAGVTHA